jgi:hypothetical protein
VWWLEKYGSLFFHRKHPIDLIKPINGHQKANKPPQNPLGKKNSSQA